MLYQRPARTESYTLVTTKKGYIMYHVGQKLWFVPAQRRNGQERELTIMKIGRKWLTMDNEDRVSIDDLIVDGGNYSSLGRCYVDRVAYEQEKTLKDAWTAFRQDADRMRQTPELATIEAIQQARKLLGV